MSIISEVKCARCDRKYSGVRSRCPYCGARRIGRGKYSEETDNSKGKMLIGVLIMGVLVIAVVFLLLSAPKVEKDTPSNQISSHEGPDIPNENDTIGVTGISTITPTPTPTPTPEEVLESPAPAVQSVMILFDGKEKNDFTAKVSETVILRVKVDPIDFEDEIIWSSSDKSVFEVVKNNELGTQAKVTGIGKGNAKVIVSVGGVEDDCIVRVKNK